MTASIDRFSWTRVMGVTRYYSSPMRRMITIYSVITVVIYLLALLTSIWDLEFIIASLGSTVMQGMWIFSSLVFVLKNDTAASTLLPARGEEKATVVLLWTLLFIPLLLIAEWTLCIGIASIFTSKANVTGSLMKITYEMYGDNSLLIILNHMSNLIPVITVLYVVMTVKTNRIAMGIAAAVGALIGVGLIGAVVGFISAFTGDNSILAIAKEQGTVDETALAISMTSMIGKLITIMGIFSLIYTAVGITLTWRRIVNRQV